MASPTSSSSAKPAPKRPWWRRLLSAAGWLFLALFALLLVTTAFGGWTAQAIGLLAFGWIGFLAANLEALEFNPRLAAEAAACLVALGVGGHWFARWLWGAMAPAGSGPWRARWTVLALASVVFLFASGIATIGFVHQAAWLAKQGRFVEDSLSIRYAAAATANSAARAMAAVEAFRARTGRFPDSAEEAGLAGEQPKAMATLKGIGPGGKITIEPAPELRFRGGVVLTPSIEGGRPAWTCASTLDHRGAALACRAIDERP